MGAVHKKPVFITPLIRVGTSRKEELRLMKLFFHGAMLVEILDDVFLEGSTLVRGKDKALLNQFRTHFAKKYGKHIEEMFERETEYDYYVLEDMKTKIRDILEDTLHEHFRFD